jgi:tetratricopeptide (TPR) repeat protein
LSEGVKPMAKTTKQFTLASEHLRMGNLTRARSLSRRILQNDPAHAGAWHLLGVVLAAGGDFATAAAALVRAIQLGGPEPLWCANLGRVLLSLGRPVEAAASLRQALAGDPRNPRISLELGSALSTAGQLPGAVLAFEHATQLDPACPDAWFQLGNAQFQSRDYHRAALSYERVLALRPDHPESHYNLGVIRMAEQQTPQAAACFRRAVELNPGYAEAHNNLALLDHKAGNLESAEREYRLALLARGGFEIAEYNLARLFQDRGELERCRDAYLALLKRCPDLVDPHTNLGNALRGLGDVRGAVEEYRAALRLDPASVGARFNLGLALLQLGEWEEGWGLYECRWRQPGVAPRHADRPLWDGTSLEGRSILIHAEQGLGDTLQFSRFAALVEGRGGQVLLEAQPALRRILMTLGNVAQVLPRGSELPEFECQAPLMSLPGILGTNVETVPAEVPYLLADSELVEWWSAALARAVGPRTFRVGLTWAGDPGRRNDRDRSMPSSAFDQLKEVAGVAYFDLQKGATDLPALDLHPMVEHCADMADTAAAILNLDLVISVDTAVAHLAGALGKPVWTLLSFAADWRWLLDRSDTPWYPTMRLFRQPARGDWDSVLREVREELGKMAGGQS